MRIALVSRELYPTWRRDRADRRRRRAELAEIAEVTVVTSGASREEHERLRAAGDPRLLPETVRIGWVDEPGDGWGGWNSYMQLYSARARAVLKALYGDRGPDLIEFCDYLGRGLRDRAGPRTPPPRGCATRSSAVRLHTTSEMCAVLDGHLPDDFQTVAIHDAERYALRHADRILWSGGDVLGTYRALLRRGGARARASRCPTRSCVEREAAPDAGGAPRAGEPLRLLYLGRLERRKGVQNLLRALTALERDDWQLTLLGGDTDTGPLGTLAAAPARADGVRATTASSCSTARAARGGRAGHPTSTHVVVVPSLWECWPNVGARGAAAQPAGAGHARSAG